MELMCNSYVEIGGAWFHCNKPDGHLEEEHQAQGDYPVRFTITWRLQNGA